ncbi:MAG: lysophospholipase, partial [Acidimicrobiia bacterium]|nr:lysophospholipase [Acidimicrobiia bacterium]
AALDQVERADEFDVPILLLHGSDDATVPVESADQFAEARPDIVRYQRFDGVDHVLLWNADPARYEAAVMGFLADVTFQE